MRTVAVLPSVLTLGNLLCGFTAIFLASRPPETSLPWDWTPLTFAATFIFIAMIFDALDGSVARLTRNTSDLGAQLDSMADMVTFGVAPAIIAVHLIGIRTPFFGETDVADRYFDRITLVIAAIYVACAALRLARFNIELNAAGEEEDDHSSFKGLPSPGAAGTVASMVLLHEHFIAHEAAPSSWRIVGSSVVLVAIMLLVAFAMVSRLKYSHVTNRYIRGRARFGVFSRIMVLLMLLAIAPQASIALAFVLYALSAPVQWVIHSIWRREHPPDRGEFKVKS